MMLATHTIFKGVCMSFKHTVATLRFKMSKDQDPAPSKVEYIVPDNMDVLAVYTACDHEQDTVVPVKVLIVYVKQNVNDPTIFSQVACLTPGWYMDSCVIQSLDSSTAKSDIQGLVMKISEEENTAPEHFSKDNRVYDDVLDAVFEQYWKDIWDDLALKFYGVRT